MRKRGNERRLWVAVIAAYALLLQTLVAGLVAAPMPAVEGASGVAVVMCHEMGGGSVDPAHQHDHGDLPCCAFCGMASGAVAALPTDAAFVAVDRPDAKTPGLAPSGERPPRQIDLGAAQARGPPRFA